MKSLTALFLAALFSLSLMFNVHAQGAESIWLAASTTSYKTGETVIVTIQAASATPIQGFTFQVRYDPDCLRPIHAVSTLPGMNALPLPQLIGQVDGSYASTTPQVVNGVLAEIHFTALRGCETTLTLESAALAIRNQSGFAVPLSGITLGERSVAILISMEKGVQESFLPVSGSVLPLDPPVAPQKSIPGWVLGLVSVLLAGGAIIGFSLLRKKPVQAAVKAAASAQHPRIQIKRGPQAGKNFILNKVPCLIGSDPLNDICLNDPNIQRHHAKIYTSNNAYYLMDLGGATFINGQAVNQNAVPLRSGDVVRLGKSALFVFKS